MFISDKTRQHIRLLSISLSWLILWGCYVAPPAEEASTAVGSDVHLVVASSTKQELAIEAAEKFRKAGYPAEVYQSSSQFFAVTLGHYPPAKAKELKQKVIAEGLAGNDAYLTSGQGFIGRIYPASAEVERFYVVAATSKNETAAKQLCDRLRQMGYPSEVFLTKTKTFAVTLDHLPAQEAQTLKSFAIRKGIVEDDSYVSTGNEFAAKRYPADPGAAAGTADTPLAKDLYLVVLTTTDQNIAIREADKYHKKGYGAEVYYTMNKNYVVTLGLFPRQKAKALKDEVLLKKVVPADCYLTAGEDFMERIHSTIAVR